MRVLQASSGEIQTRYQRGAQNADGQMSHQSMKFSFLLPHLFCWSWFPNCPPCSDLLGSCSQKQKWRGCVQLGRSCSAAPRSWLCSPSPKPGSTAPLPELELYWEHRTQTPLNTAQSWQKLEGKCIFPKLTLPSHQESQTGSSNQVQVKQAAFTIL